MHENDCKRETESLDSCAVPHDSQYSLDPTPPPHICSRYFGIRTEAFRFCAMIGGLIAAQPRPTPATLLPSNPNI